MNRRDMFIQEADHSDEFKALLFDCYSDFPHCPVHLNSIDQANMDNMGSNKEV